MKRFMMGVMAMGNSLACVALMFSSDSPTVVIIAAAIGASANGICAAINVMEALFGDDGLYPLWHVPQRKK